MSYNGIYPNDSGKVKIMYYIGIDIGTTTISGVVFDQTAHQILTSRTLESRSFLQTGQDWERVQDANLILSKATALLNSLLEQYPDAAGIGLTGQMHGIVYVDDHGRHTSHLYTWQDERGRLPLEDGSDTLSRCAAHTPWPTASGYGLVSHLYNVYAGLVPEQAVGLCTIPDLLAMALTGNRKPLLHTSMAASLGFWNTKAGRFDADGFTAAGGDCSILPLVTDDLTVLGTYRGIPVTIPIGDNQASFLGSMGQTSNGILLNMGTGGQVSVAAERYYDIPGVETRPFLKNAYLLVGSSLCGGRAYAILERFFRSYVKAATGVDCSQYGIMEGLAREIDVATLMVDTALKGTRSDPDRTGGIQNLTEDNFLPAQLIRGVMEGMIRELHELYVQMAHTADLHPAVLVASGNGLRKNSVLRDISSAMFGLELQLAQTTEEAASGAAISCFLSQ